MKSAKKLPAKPPKRAGKKANLNSASSLNGSSGPRDKFVSGYDFLFINRDIEPGLLGEVMECAAKFRRNKKVVLILVTYGGIANEAYRVARYLHSVYEEIVAFIPSLCKSAGTLIVTAADSVIISAFGEIGPLDVQLQQRDEIYGSRSGLTTRSALDDLKSHSFELFQYFMLSIVNSSGGAISFRLASEISSKVTAEVMSKVYEKISPESLGQDFRDLNIATKYCEMLNKKYQNLRPGAIKRLVHGYPSHDFVIDAEEATEIFFRSDLPTGTLYALMLARMSDMFIPKSRKGSMVEMLMIDGKAMVHDDRPAETRARRRDVKRSSERSEGRVAQREAPKA